MDNIGESRIETEAFNDVRNFLLMYYKITAIAFTVLLFAIFTKSFVLTVMLEAILIYIIWIIALWLVFKYFRKNKSIAGLIILTVLTFPFGFVFLACYENIKELENDKEVIAFNEVRDFLLFYFMLTGTLIILWCIVSFEKILSWYMPGLFVSLLLYVLWVLMLWFIYKDFRKNKNMSTYYSLIVLTLPYGLIMISCRKKINEAKYISKST